jgi:adenylate cyclase class 2
MRSEIEVKARVEDKEALRQALVELGCVFNAPVRQDDTVFALKIGTLEEFLSNDSFLRIRIQDDGTVILTAKKQIRKSEGGLVKIEHETIVQSADASRSILELMGYQEAVRVKKSRQTAHLKEYEICLDDIEGLGLFIELEQMGESDDAPAIQKDMLDFLLSLGISADTQVKKGYDILMIEKNGSAA